MGIEYYSWQLPGATAPVSRLLCEAAPDLGTTSCILPTTARIVHWRIDGTAVVRFTNITALSALNTGNELKWYGT
jgi:hypothetical protein